ncbi:Quinolinate synthase A [Marinobacter sp. BSs20148]|nr:Quinolinate synthase A [Marinobacter sp. BSs20148]
MTKAEDRIRVQEYLAHAAEPKLLSAEEKTRLEARIKAALRKKTLFWWRTITPIQTFSAWLKKAVAVSPIRWKWPDLAINIPRLP